MTQPTLRRRGLIGAAAALAAAQVWPARAADDSPIVIGQSGHLSGPLAPSFKGTLAGQRIALDEFNAKGGVDGRPVKLVQLDDAYDPAKCAANVHKLIDEEKCTALFGLASTANVAAVLPLLIDRQVPLIGVYTGSPALRAKHHPYFFTTMASYRDEVVKMVKNQKTLLRDRIALVYMNNPFGQLMVPVVNEVVKEQDARLVASVPFEADAKNTADVLKALSAAKPDAVVIMAFGPTIVPLVKAVRSLGVPQYAVSIANSKSLIAALGNDARGLVFTSLIPNPWRPTGLAGEFNAAMAKADVAVDHDHFFGYLNLRILLEGLRRAGRGVTPKSLVATMERMSQVDFGGYAVSYAPGKHHGTNYVDIVIVGEGGRYLR
jgi:ABC-type branched-subunit amino acid transport system substrate-binding protein